MKNPFKRNKQTDQAPAMPPELTEYYNAEKRQRTAVTWMLGFATLVVTVAIAFGLFLGARWIINKVRNDDKAPEPTPTTQTTQPTTGNAPAATDQPATPTTPQTQGQSNTTPTGPQTSSTSTTPNKKLPSTGPGDVVAVATVVTAAGTLLHYRRSIKRA
jgi:hypothetical protein